MIDMMTINITIHYTFFVLEYPCTKKPQNKEIGCKDTRHQKKP